VFCTGSQLSGDLSNRAMDALGEVLYNLYGSTEVSYATIATPADLRAAPGTVGRAALGVRVKILGPDGDALGAGVTGRVFVGSTSPFEGYTGGGSKEQIDGLLCTGDLGHFDNDELLYIDGREDEMIVSGGENVFPREVEELLIAHPQIHDVAAIGVEDPDFGQRLAVFVVCVPGATLDENAVREHVKANLARYKATSRSSANSRATPLARSSSESYYARRRPSKVTFGSDKLIREVRRFAPCGDATLGAAKRIRYARGRGATARYCATELGAAAGQGRRSAQARRKTEAKRPALRLWRAG
jgi:long-subunit acyl-CoA synthetase (AMP-forming)